jgi:hypothetical protein
MVRPIIRFKMSAVDPCFERRSNRESVRVEYSVTFHYFCGLSIHGNKQVIASDWI